MRTSSVQTELEAEAHQIIWETYDWVNEQGFGGNDEVIWTDACENLRTRLNLTDEEIEEFWESYHELE